MLNKKVGLIVLFVSMAVSELFAGTLTSYANGDVLICFRKSGGANDFVVDAGSISTFTNATPNQRINITQFTTNQLYVIGLNSVIFSAFTWFDDSVAPTNQWILFMSRGRTSLNTQTAPWARLPQASQSTVGGDMSTIAGGASVCLSYNGLNTASAMIEPDDSGNTIYGVAGQSYFGALGGNFDFNGDFSGSPEKTAPANFITGSTVVRSDFYQIPPSFPPSDTTITKVKFLGYFELNTNGLLSYVAYPSGTPTVPVITAVSRTNTTTYVSFTTGSFGIYTLRGTNSLTTGIPSTNWPAITSTNVSSSSTKTLTDITSDSNKFYIITAQ